MKDKWDILKDLLKMQARLYPRTAFTYGELYKLMEESDEIYNKELQEVETDYMKLKNKEKTK